MTDSITNSQARGALAGARRRVVLASVLAAASTTAGTAGGRATLSHDVSAARTNMTSSSRASIARTASGATAPGAGGFVIESNAVDFGALEPGVPAEMLAALRVRVFAARDWTLKIVPDTPMRLLDGRSASIPHSRLSWRTPATGTFVPLTGPQPKVLARGRTTGPAGQLVVVDLRMQMDDLDEIGPYGCDYRLLLENP